MAIVKQGGSACRGVVGEGVTVIRGINADKSWGKLGWLAVWRLGFSFLRILPSR
jgi:hypothetical protein